MHCVIKKPLFLVFFSLLVSSSLAQRSEVGFGLGTFNYTGDLVRTYNFKYSKPAGTVFYRSNLSKVVSFRVGVTAGKIGASEVPIDPFATQRNASFDLFLLEASTVMEYHFLNWRETKRFVRFTPYLFAGLGLFGISGDVQKTESIAMSKRQFPSAQALNTSIIPSGIFPWSLG